MPIHDWTRVSAGTWHDFHLAWIAELRNALNGGLLPPDYYAQAEQIAGPLGPDVLTLQETDASPKGSPYSPAGGGVGGASAAPPGPHPAPDRVNDNALETPPPIHRPPRRTP